MLVSLAIGVVTSITIALASAASRPTNGWPNIFGNSDWESRYFAPRIRANPPGGEVWVDVRGGAMYTEVTVNLPWNWTPEVIAQFDDQYRWPKDVDPALYPSSTWGDISTYKTPYWTVLPTPDLPDQILVTTAWGWPLHCLSGVEHRQRGETAQGPDESSTFDGYWVRSPDTMHIAPTIRFNRVPLRVGRSVSSPARLSRGTQPGSGCEAASCGLRMLKRAG